MDKKFKKHDGTEVGNIIEYITDYMDDADNRIKYDIFIGCDSQVNRYSTIYSVVIGIHTIIDGIGRGVHIIHTREKDKRFKETRSDIFKRLQGEIERIVETALYLRDHGIDTTDIGTHVDANGNKKFASNMIYNYAINYLTSLGFKVEGKPYAWAATYAANTYCR